MSKLNYIKQAILREIKAKYSVTTFIPTVFGPIFVGIAIGYFSLRIGLDPGSDYYRLLIESQVVIISITVAILSASISFSNYPDAKKYVIYTYRIFGKIAALIILSLVFNLILYFQDDLLDSWIPESSSGAVELGMSITLLSVSLIYIFYHQGLLLGTSRSLVNSLGNISIADREAKPEEIESSDTATGVFYRTLKAAIQQDDIQFVDLGLSEFEQSTKTTISNYARESPDGVTVDPEPRYLSSKINEFCNAWKSLARTANIVDNDVYIYKITQSTVEICSTIIKKEIYTYEVRDWCWDLLYSNLKIAIESTEYAYRIIPDIVYSGSPPRFFDWNMNRLFNEAFETEEERWQKAIKTQDQIIELKSEIQTLENRADNCEIDDKIDDIEDEIEEKRTRIEKIQEDRTESPWGFQDKITDGFVSKISDLAKSTQEDMIIRARIGNFLLSWMEQTIESADEFEKPWIEQKMGTRSNSDRNRLSASDYYHSVYSNIETAYLSYLKDSLDNDYSAAIALFYLIKFGETAYKHGANRVAIRIPNFLIGIYYYYDLTVENMSVILALYGYITKRQLVIDSFDFYHPASDSIIHPFSDSSFGSARIWELEEEFECTDPPEDLERKKFVKDDIDDLLAEFTLYIEEEVRRSNQSQKMERRI